MVDQAESFPENPSVNSSLDDRPIERARRNAQIRQSVIDQSYAWQSLAGFPRVKYNSPIGKWPKINVQALLRRKEYWTNIKRQPARVHGTVA